jgi:sterol desaturase/sphingolipid hydroxylase (fatty acid hydroxylase superfamily)
MTDLLVRYETWIRLSVFVGIFAVMTLWEVVAPRRLRPVPRSARWPSNLALVALNTLLMRLILPTSAVAVALAAEAQGIGLIPWLSVPSAAAFAVALVLLDLAIYLQHALFHAVPWLWRLHRMHHADVDVDATNGLRFHPFEIVLSMLIKFAVILLVGAPAAAVVVFEVMLSSLAVFNHSNVGIPESWDKRLRWLLVTPDMHRIHHSWHAEEHSRNFGFNLSGWDRLFGTYLAQPRDGQENMTLGLPILRDRKWLRLDNMLRQPFVREPLDNE